MHAQGDDQADVVAEGLFKTPRTPDSRRATGSTGAPRTSVAPQVALSSSVACQSWRVQPKGIE